MIDRHLGPRVKTAGFSYSEIIANQLGMQTMEVVEINDLRPFDVHIAYRLTIS